MWEDVERGFSCDLNEDSRTRSYVQKFSSLQNKVVVLLSSRYTFIIVDETTSAELGFF